MRQLALALAVGVLTALNPMQASHAQQQDPAAALQAPEGATYIIYVRTDFAAPVTSQDTTIHQNLYVASWRDSCSTSVTQALAAHLSDRLSMLGNVGQVIVAPIDSTAYDSLRFVASDSTSFVLNTLRLDSDGSMAIESRVTRPPSGEELLSVMPEKILDGQLRSLLGLSEGQHDGLERAAKSLGRQLAQGVEDAIFQLFINSMIRLWVQVVDFEQLDRDTTKNYLAQHFKKTLERELSKSDGIIVYIPDVNRSTSDSAAAVDYRITGYFTVIGDQVHIDVRCIKRPFDRILVARDATASSIDVDTLDEITTDLAKQIARIMESDFRRSSKAIAIVAAPPTPIADVSAADSTMVIDVVHAVAQKLRRLTTDAPEGRRRLEVLGGPYQDSEDVITSGTPSQVLARIDADYVAMVSYARLGTDVSIGMELHSFDMQRPGAGQPIGVLDADRALIDPAVDSLTTLLALKLSRLGFAIMPLPEDSDSARAYVHSLITEVKTQQSIKDKQFSFRIGPVLRRANEDLFFGDISATYLELSLAYMPSFLSFGKPNGRFDGGLEVLWGIDLGGNFSPDLVLVHSGLLNFRFFLTPWRAAGTAINVAAGAGAGFQVIRYNFDPGDPRFLGTTDYRESTGTVAFSLFLQGDFRLFGPFKGDAILRWTRGLNELTRFESAPFEGGGPTGHLGAIYMAFGVAWRFR